MKRIIVKVSCLICFCFTIASCELGNDQYSQYSVALNLTAWDLPDTVNVSTPFNIILRSKTESSCLSNLRFVVSKNGYDEIHSMPKYYVYAQATYENHGETCYEQVAYKDSTMSFTLSEAGKYYFYFAKNDIYNKDSIVVNP
jgi:hypothetical protein